MLRNFFGRQGKTHAGRNGWLGDAHCAGRDKSGTAIQIDHDRHYPFWAHYLVMLCFYGRWCQRASSWHALEMLRLSRQYFTLNEAVYIS